MSTETGTPANPFRTPIVTNSKPSRVFPGGLFYARFAGRGMAGRQGQNRAGPHGGPALGLPNRGQCKYRFYSAVYRVRTVAICARLAVLSGARVLLPIPEITPSPTAQVMASTA